MISNEYQRRLSLAQAHKFEQALGNLDILSAPDGVHPLLRQAERAALESQLETLRHDIREYDALSAGESKEFSIDSLDEQIGSVSPMSRVRWESKFTRR
ncbi:MAG: hypothetical protein NT023_10385 [Armatimonadetes bacterium]|nr:hypothetical protein [Armatimonadota bacterium]